jgi:hypothetical protein
MTVEERIRLLIGNLMIENIALAAKVEELQKKIEELSKDKNE